MKLIRSLVHLLRARRSPASGGQLPPYRPQGDARMAVLSPGKTITDPDEADALGLTATARRLRQRRP